VIRRHAQQLAQVGLRRVADLHKMPAAMAHFHHRHAAAVPIQHLGSDLLQYRFRQGRRARRKVPGTSHHCSVGSVGSGEASVSPSASGASASSPSMSSASLSTTRRTPDRLLPSSTLINVTPCVARPISRISPTRVRTSTPPVVISMISSDGMTSTAPTTLPLRDEVWMAIMPLVPRPWRVYSV